MYLVRGLECWTEDRGATRSLSDLPTVMLIQGHYKLTRDPSQPGALEADRREVRFGGDHGDPRERVKRYGLGGDGRRQFGERRNGEQYGDQDSFRVHCCGISFCQIR